jgi:hypothetical protein
VTVRLVVELPPRFYDDHVSRELPAGTEIHRTARLVTVELSREDYAELRSDAEHYAGGRASGFDDPDLFGLVSSARATLRRLPTQWPLGSNLNQEERS